MVARFPSFEHDIAWPYGRRISFPKTEFLETTVKRTLLLCLLAAASPATAAKFQSMPISTPTDSISYERGAPVIERDTAFGQIRITSIDEEAGKPAFVIEILNESGRPINFGTENVKAAVAGQKKQTLVYTADEIQKMVEADANFAAGMASLSGDLAASNTKVRSCGRKGCVTEKFTTPNYMEQRKAARKVDSIERDTANRLDDLAQNYLQTTTVRSGRSYAGRVAISKPKVDYWPAKLTLTVLGERFSFEMTK